MLFHILFLTALASQAFASLVCDKFQPKNWTAKESRIYVTSGTEVGSIFDRPSLLPTYAGVGNPWKLRYKYNPGADFVLKKCNSTELGLSSYIQSSCSHGGCYIAYYNYIQIINPYTGHCLTTQNWNASVTSLEFTTCNSNPADTSQLWEASQYVNYSPDYAGITSYGEVDLDPVQRGALPSIDYPFFAWYISEQDNKSLEVIQYEYTQHGVFLQLVQSP